MIKAMEAKEIAVRIRKSETGWLHGAKIYTDTVAATEARVKADNEWVVVDGTEDWELIDSA